MRPTILLATCEGSISPHVFAKAANGRDTLGIFAWDSPFLIQGIAALTYVCCPGLVTWPGACYLPAKAKPLPFAHTELPAGDHRTWLEVEGRLVTPSNLAIIHAISPSINFLFSSGSRMLQLGYLVPVPDRLISQPVHCMTLRGCPEVLLAGTLNRLSGLLVIFRASDPTTGPSALSSYPSHPFFWPFLAWKRAVSFFFFLSHRKRIPIDRLLLFSAANLFV